MGSYRLQEVIGRGGMGEVWRAQHNLLARPAAIKLIRQDALGAGAGDLEAALARFEREAQVTAGLQSPHTVRLYDFGAAEDGSFYYVMELLEGVDLESLVQEIGPLPGERAVHILRQACRSLGEAHDQGLVHRDIKPANIYICRRAAECDFVKVLDFGLVKRASGIDSANDPTATDVGAVAGTPAYMSPEIARGIERIDGRADLYALGCVAFWLLAGRRVFEAESPIEMIVAHLREAAPAPSTVSEVPVPAAIDALVLACLAKDPADRPARAEDLETALGGLELANPWTRARAAEWWATHRPGDINATRAPQTASSID